MTAKNRQKSGTAEKTAAPSQEDAPKKNQKTSSNGTSSSPSQGSSSGSCLGFFATAVFYVTLLGASGFAAFYLQQVMEEIRQTSFSHEKSAQQNAELLGKMQTVTQQVESLLSVVDGLESSLGITRGEMEGAISRMKRGEVETRKVEEALRKLQNNLLSDLSKGMAEVKEEREKDFSSLEQTVEERLAKASQSIKASVTEFTEAQEDTKTQLSELKARLGDMEDPALVKQELSTIVDTVAEIRTAKQEADASVDSLRQQISSVREELQTRNQEVASLSQEIEAVRKVVQENFGHLKQSLSEAEVSVQVVKDHSVTLETRVEQTAEAVRSVEVKLVETTAHNLKKSDELESRVKASEESVDSLSNSLSDITSKVESLLSRCDTNESTLEQELVALKKSVEELQSSLTDVNAQVELVSQDSSLSAQVGNLGKRLEAVESSAGSVKPEQLKNLQSLVSSLENKAAKLEVHEEAISGLQKTLHETTQTLASLSKAPKGKK
ncbi:cytoskeleton-associated protein 4 [Eucyclogobius newberryi]|uniref:cytoskeleton-associated protein 4 n=1 Tax=Eucyclogobius newberryi TaxID=166745 RepID=UPI003B59D352